LNEIKESGKALPIIRTEYKPWLVSGILLFSDLAAITASFFLSLYLRKWLIPLIGGTLDYNQVAPLFLLLILIILIVFAFAGFYPGHGRTGLGEFREIVYIVSFAHIVVAMIVFILGYGPRFSRLMFLFSWVIGMVLIVCFRLILHNRGSLLRWWAQPAVVIGRTSDTTMVIQHLKSARRLGYKPAAAILTEKSPQLEIILGVPVFAYSEDLLHGFRDANIQLGIFTDRSFASSPADRKSLHVFSLIFPKLIYVLSDSPLSMVALKTMDLDGHPALHIRYNLLNPFTDFVKRVIDLVMSLISLVITLPLFLFFSIWIRLDSRGPILYKQVRMSKGGKHFNMYKFRTMVVDADEQLKAILEADVDLREEFEKYHKLQKDPRVTRAGKLLRKTSLDELPQLINIIKGDMSWVGPRPFQPSELEQIGESAEIIHRVLPGLTGWWQVMGRHNVEFSERLKLDEYYISNYSLLMDAYILLKTVFIVVTGRGS